MTPALRSAVIGEVADELARSDARLMALAIMSNHFHLLVQQGERSLDRLMQPLLRRLALRVQRRSGIEGPVFWRPYASELCQDPEHIRNAVVYVHINPVRAGLAADPSSYPWTSHLFYCDASPRRMPAPLRPLVGVLDPAPALPLFAMDDDRSPTRLAADYVSFVAARLKNDQAGDEATLAGAAGRSRTPSARANLDWASALSPLFHVPLRDGAWSDSPSDDAGRPDLASLAAITLAAEAPGLPLEGIKGRRGGREYARLRHVVVRRLAAAGFRQARIADFMNLSGSAVSKVLRSR